MFGLATAQYFLQSLRNISYADDTQLNLSFKPADSSSEVEAVSAMQTQQLSKVSIQSIKTGQTEVSPVASARNLGTWFDTHLDMGTHITKTCSSAFYYLYNIRHIRKYLSRESTEKLVHAFISSRLDYCNSLLYGIPEFATCYECECKTYISRAQVLSYNTSTRRITLVTSALQDTL